MVILYQESLKNQLIFIVLLLSLFSYEECALILRYTEKYALFKDTYDKFFKPLVGPHIIQSHNGDQHNNLLDVAVESVHFVGLTRAQPSNLEHTCVF